MERLRATLLTAAFLGLSAQADAASPWLEVKSEHFRVITNSGDREARHTVWQFEQIRQALLLTWPWAQVDGGRPFVIFAVRDENTLKTLGPQYWEGKRYRPTSFWTASADREYVALRTDVPEPSDASSNPYQGAYFAYVSMVFNRSMPSGAPMWYVRGLAEVMSNTIVREKELHIGRLMEDNLRRVREGGLVPQGEFLSADRRSHWLTQESDAQLFEAQAWAFVHALMFAEQGAYSTRLDRFNRLLFQGTAADVAMKESFGPDMTPYMSMMRSYIRRDLFQYMRGKVDLNLKPEGFTTTPLSPVDAATERGEMLAAMGRPVEARAAAAEARAADPSSPGPDGVEAALLDREQKLDEAKAAYAKAVERGSKRGYHYYRLAVLDVGNNATTDTARARGASLLEKANQLEPGFAPAWSYHAQLRSDMNESQKAFELAAAAIRLEPKETYHRMVAARALWNAGMKDEALKAARVGAQVANTDSERADAQRFIDFASAASPPLPRVSNPVGREAGVVTSQSAPAASASGAAVQTPVRIGPEGDDAYSCFSTRNDAACARALPGLERSCEAKEALACRSLGSLHDGGFGIPLSKSKAAKAYDAGCALGDKASCARYAVLRVQGLAPPRDDTPGLMTLETLCGETIEDACVGWALILNARGGSRDAAKSRALLQASCDRNTANACEILKKMPPVHP